MHRRSAWWRWSKWASTFACVAIAIFWAISYSGQIVAHVGSQGAVFLWRGRVRQPFTGILPPDFSGPRGWQIYSRNTLPFGIDDIDLPLWLPMMLVAVPAALLWCDELRSLVRRWSTKLPRRCEQCRYDLTGNVSGVCPECGRRAKS